MPNTKNSNRIVKSGINNEAIRNANRFLSVFGKRICKYTGDLLDLDSKNFNKNGNDYSGFQQVSKLGMQLYHSNSLEVKTQDEDYVRNMNKASKLA